MEKINTETLVSSLFVIGFDKVDALLYTYTLGQLSLDNQKLQLFKFEDSSMSQEFNDYVDYDGITFKLKEGLTLKTNISPLENYDIPLEKALHTNEKLIEYLSKLDFRKIIIKKIETLGVDKIISFYLLFSNEEKEIMYKMFGIEAMHKENSISQLQFYNSLINQESNDIDKTLNSLGTIKKKVK